ncbi:uncharacterized protein si:ch211-217g15.3 [Thunnus maccoyii]|uniref:uncharacterized protein si:ch211-217g15.3 n=1 Tax=Thunnus maccoyii TaxID=8240 RepID=UPI001C4B9E26|nr:uncharacterized protein si:ch211-217g15.3 [Thunnus maccoyii]XP_042289124.1 uncharacterized protein si:ch211-217g15.3 [Thunnus maccoyii]
MSRISLIVCIFLICGVTAKPYKPWNQLTHEAFLDTVMSVDATGKMSWRVEVEPPEDMDETQHDIDPSMMIWKKMTGTGQEKQPLKPEEDLDELYHPSVADLLKVQTHNLDALPAADIQSEPSQKNANSEYNLVPEEDRDDIDHPVFSNVAFEEPEQDWDEIYRKANKELDAYLAPLVAEHKSGAEFRAPDLAQYHHYELLRREVRVHLQPEEDMDDLYHPDLQQPIPRHDDAKAAAPVDQPSQRKYSEPEEDLDDLHHL